MFTIPALFVAALTLAALLTTLTDAFVPSFEATPAAPDAAAWDSVREALAPAPAAALFNPSPAALAHWAAIDAARLDALRSEIACYYRGEDTPLFPALAAGVVSDAHTGEVVATVATADATAVTRAAGAPRSARVVSVYWAGAAAGAVVVREDGSRVSGLVSGLAAALRGADGAPLGAALAAADALALAALA